MELIKLSFDGLIKLDGKEFFAELKEYSTTTIKNGILLTQYEKQAFEYFGSKLCLVIYNKDTKEYFIFNGVDISRYLDSHKRTFKKHKHALYNFFHTSTGQPKIKCQIVYK